MDKYKSIKIVPPASKNGITPAQGTKVFLSDGTELDRVTSIKLEASVGGLWQATITCFPEEIVITDAVARQVIQDQFNMTAEADKNGEVKIIVDTTCLGSDSRTYEIAKIRDED